MDIKYITVKNVEGHERIEYFSTTFHYLEIKFSIFKQELIESITWAHNKLKVAPAIQPRALSITQGRAVGVAHYLLGGIATTWSFFLARIIAVG